MSTHNTTTTTHVTTVRELKVQGVNRTIPYRLVGSYEYGKCLESFMQLIKISTLDELPVYDTILNDRPEFTYFNGVSSAFNNFPNLAKADEITRTKFCDEYQKKGLRWMIALARIELGSTMSMYGESKTPFESVAKTNYDMEATMQVLSDDVTAHMKSLALEEGFKKVIKRGRDIDTWTIAYLRRLKLIRDMLSTLGRFGDNTVKAKLGPYDKELAKYENRLMDEIERQTQPKTFMQNNVTNRQTQTRARRISNKEITDCENVVSKPSTPSQPFDGPGGRPSDNNGSGGVAR
ncbi:MAG: hypothetical protein AB8B55_13840 [Mariniblastus sp.]